MSLHGRRKEECYYSLPVGQRMRSKVIASCRNRCSITDILLEHVMRLHGQNEGQHHSQAGSYDKTTWQERGSVTHILLAMGDVMRSMSEKKVESLTPC